MTTELALFRDGLPESLTERIREVSAGTRNPEGTFVLYWMHHAARGHDNPALDVAVSMGNRLGVPVLVYQGLSGGHRFNSDRHHTFIMEGARDVHRELATRGVTYTFHLSRNPSGSSPLTGLAGDAALVIAEDFPAPPFPSWTQALASRVSTSVWAVDGHCIVPMKSIGESYDRAFLFRKRTAAEFAERVPAAWTDVTPHIPRWSGDPGFEPVDLRTADIAELCAECDIDHSVGPAGHTRGGSVAGYERWGAFRDKGLPQYADLRNDASVTPPLGVSRMSPYLHHGHVSPFRIAREARRSPAAGAAKFLDELLIWRELAYNLCLHRSNIEELGALPDWARDTLLEHADDPRKQIISWERLSRARSGNRLWDAAQRSLLLHGELHNNIRMTWGKALLQWTPGPEEALQMLIDLNHRYALDGNDPNSYGGLLWCLGCFDRPFAPETPVLGAVRPRPIADHARRLDLDRYEAHVDRLARARDLSVGVVGAGISGLTAARTLVDQGMKVTVFDRGREPGGRASSRCRGDLQFDHGAQYFTAREETFLRYVRSWMEDGVVQPWTGRIGVAGQGTVKIKKPSVVRYVGTPGMQTIASHLARDIGVNSGVDVSGMNRDGDRWMLVDTSGGELGRFDVILLAMPPAQARTLVGEASSLAHMLTGITMNACWAALVAFHEPVDIEADGLFIEDETLSWAARDSSKPGRPPGEAWVIHATPQWSEKHVHAPATDVTVPLVKAFHEATGATASGVRHVEGHRWRYALAAEPLSSGCLWDGVAGVGVCGDWCNGSRIEGAFLSGLAMAGRVMGHCNG